MFATPPSELVDVLEDDELDELELDELPSEPAPPPDEDELHAVSRTAHPTDATRTGNPRMSRSPSTQNGEEHDPTRAPGANQERDRDPQIHPQPGSPNGLEKERNMA